MPEIWQASEARRRFADLVDGALAGVPQLVRKRGGDEVVVLSRKDYEGMKPTLRDVLLRGGPATEEEDVLDAAVKEARREGIQFMEPRDVDLDD